MYKIQKHKSKKSKNKKKLFIITAVIAALLLGGGFALFVRADKKTQPSSEDQATNSSSASEQGASKQNDETVEPKKAPKADDGTPLGNGNGSSQSDSNADVTITAQYFSESSSRAIVKAIVEDTESGTCKAVFKKSGQPNVTKSAPVEVVTSYYACGDLSVPKSKFPVSGQWSVSVQLIQEGAVRATSSAEAIAIP